MSVPTDSHLFREVAGQADDWAAVVGRLGEVAGRLPARGARVAVVGCGTSYSIASSYAVLREQAGQGETDAWAASEHRLTRDYDHVVVISRSGTTTEPRSCCRAPSSAPSTPVTVSCCRSCMPWRRTRTTFARGSRTPTTTPARSSRPPNR